jgi:hypothetical protein
VWKGGSDPGLRTDELETVAAKSGRYAEGRHKGPWKMKQEGKEVWQEKINKSSNKMDKNKVKKYHWIM